ncbi:MAG: nuclear transport factor 2 family protein [Verrucomicrobia bacterium]|nr:nuclear transport factor 2 family protein [Verrucomicrobiota bacterium]
MNQKNRAIAYYSAFGEKNLEEVAKYLHPEVTFIGPLAEMQGKEAYLDAAKKYMAFFKSQKIREVFSYGDRALLVFDYEFPAPLGHVPGASLLTFEGEHIVKIELFYDGSLFTEKKEEIFQ